MYLLTVLFTVATLCVQAVLATLPSQQAWLLGLMLGQLAVLAIWCVRGRGMHRLGRVGWTMMGAYCLAGQVDFPWSVTLAAGLLYVSAIAIVVGISDWCRGARARGDGATRWQIPLVEFFGWTILIAAVSVAGRQMDFSWLGPQVLLWGLATLVFPLAVTFVVQRDLRDLSPGATWLLVLVGLSAAGGLGAWSNGSQVLILGQAMFMLLWYAVLGYDRSLQAVRTNSAVAESVTAQQTQLHLFDPG